MRRRNQTFWGNDLRSAGDRLDLCQHIHLHGDICDTLRLVIQDMAQFRREYAVRVNVLVLPQRVSKQGPVVAILPHPIPGNGFLACGTACPAKFSCQDRQRPRGSNQDNWDAQLVVQPEEKVEHIIRSITSRLAQILNLVDDEHTDTMAESEFRHAEQEVVNPRLSIAHVAFIGMSVEQPIDFSEETLAQATQLAVVRTLQFDVQDRKST